MVKIDALIKQLRAAKEHCFLRLAHAYIGMFAKLAGQAGGAGLGSTDNHKVDCFS